MLKYILTPQSKQHPIASVLFMAYLMVWLGVTFLTYKCLVNRDADTIYNMMFYWFVGLCVPYLAANIILSRNAEKNQRGYYKDMSMMIFVPMGIVILIVVMHAVINYANMGMS